MINVLLLAKRYTGDYPLLNKMASLDERRFRCVVCYLTGERDGRNPLDERIRTYYLGLEGGEVSPWNARARRRLAAIFDDERIQVVNCHLQRTIALAVFAARLARHRPVLVATLHGLGSANSWRRRLGNLFLYRPLYKLIGVSEGVRQDMLQNNWGLRPDKVVTIHNGIDPAPFLRPGTKQLSRAELFPELRAEVWFGTVGRLARVKNQACLLLAFKRCLESCPESLLLICGRGDDEKKLKDLASSLGIAERVRFLGFRRDIPQVLAALDVFVLPSLREGLCLALLEAMSCGLPVIASQTAGSEIFGGALVGELVDPKNVTDLATAMIRLARYPEAERSVLGENARDRISRQFTAEEMIKQYEAIYEQAWRSQTGNPAMLPEMNGEP